MRDIWSSKVDWDHPIPCELLATWKNFLENYPSIERIRIPRWVQYQPGCEVQLHGFCDASEKAYAAAVYIRSETPDGVVQIHLLTAKSKVAPLKTISIPRLELCGAVLLADAIESLMEIFPIPNIKIFCWTDSMIVLAWLKKPAFSWKTFVANRVSRISEVVNVDNWFHVESKQNPADLASRGAYPSEMFENELWWRGPSWLQLSASLWPNSITEEINENLLEKKISSHFAYFHEYDDPLAWFSSFRRALRVLSYVYKFISKLALCEFVVELLDLKA
ncbi:uncharacterized protein LOC142224927 [Haematobia irritans]|uniref:uncharacterized protein LOC142224927 n=1 Tax=Haematobia irritans TaxID=7368 RepID=UPI003F5024E1